MPGEKTKYAKKYGDFIGYENHLINLLQEAFLHN